MDVGTQRLSFSDRVLLKLGLFAQAVLLLTRKGVYFTGRGTQVACYNPTYRIAGALSLAALFAYATAGVWAAAAVFGLALDMVGLWMTLRPVSFQQSLLGWRRSVHRYRFSWAKTLRRCDATKRDSPYPLLVSTHSTPFVDKLRVKVPTGLSPETFQDYRGDLLKWAWRAESVRVFNPQTKSKTVELWNIIADPLIEPVQPFAKPTEALPKDGWKLALVEDGEPWLLNIRGGAAHLFVCGISGAGKGSVIGSLLDQAQTGIEDKTVRVLGVDPQASELGMWRHLFHQLVFTQAAAADLLEAEVARMDTRTRKMFGISRQHQPKPGDEFDLVIIDEGLDLLDKTDRQLYRRIDRALRALLRKGRKASIMVVFLSQRAELDMVEIRKDFPNSIALKLKQEADVDMVLGRGALKAGADAHAINSVGVGYVATDIGIMRVRFPYLSNDYIRELPPAPDTEPAELPDEDNFGFA
jgi:S-DNA-T family DNA segregation ATPase FtsK/SpoIIIE